MRRAGRRNTRGGSTRQPYLAKVRAYGAHAHFSVNAGCSDNGSDSSWVDAIAGYTLANSGAGRMTYSTSVAALNGRPGWAAVAASSQYLSSSGALATVLDEAAQSTVYIVRKAATTSGSTRVPLCVGSTALSQWIYFGQSATNGAVIYSRRAGAGTTTTTGTVNTGTALVLETYVYDASTVNAFAGATETIASTANTRVTSALNRVILGALMDNNVLANYFDGAIGDIIVFLSAHDATQRAYVRALINAQFGM